MLIVIPARFGSTRFPGKPLVKIAGVPMLNRVVFTAQSAARAFAPQNCKVVVATDDRRIMMHCRAEGFDSVMTETSLPSGTDRAYAALREVGSRSNTIINLQGDAPFTPADHIVATMTAVTISGADVATPFIQLSWQALENLRAHKEITPFSGTTLTCDRNGKAIWFSKKVLPAIRKEEALRSESSKSPVRRHIGLYAFKRSALARYVELDEGYYEKLEGLEQLRFIENGMNVQCVEVDPPQISTSGIDTPEDLARAEILIEKYGDPLQH